MSILDRVDLCEIFFGETKVVARMLDWDPCFVNFVAKEGVLVVVR